MKEVTEVTNCPITNDSERFTYIDLGEMPLVNNLSDTREDSFNSPKYKLAVQYFKKSKYLNRITFKIENKYYNGSFVFVTVSVT